MPVGSQGRRAILAGLQKVSMEHASDEALKQYLKDHPDADPKKHTVKGGKDSDTGGAKVPSKAKRPSSEAFGKAMDALDEVDGIENYLPKQKDYRQVENDLSMLEDGGGLSVKSIDSLVENFGKLPDDAKEAAGWGTLEPFLKAEKKKMEFISSVSDDMAGALDETGGVLKDLAKGGQKMSAASLERMINEGDRTSKTWGPDEKKAWATVKAHAEAELKYWKDR
jgi:hypothetical protein